VKARRWSRYKYYTSEHDSKKMMKDRREEARCSVMGRASRSSFTDGDYFKFEKRSRQQLRMFGAEDYGRQTAQTTSTIPIRQSVIFLLPAFAILRDKASYMRDQ
jgi:hypothetical protein